MLPASSSCLLFCCWERAQPPSLPCPVPLGMAGRRKRGPWLGSAPLRYGAAARGWLQQDGGCRAPWSCRPWSQKSCCPHAGGILTWMGQPLPGHWNPVDRGHLCSGVQPCALFQTSGGNPGSFFPAVISVFCCGDQACCWKHPPGWVVWDEAGPWG